MQETLETVPNPDRVPDTEADGSGGADEVGEEVPIAEVSALERRCLLRLAYRVMWNRGEAEDAVQEALLTAHEKAGQLRERGKRWSWLCRIVIQRCYQQGRQQQRRTKHYDAYANLSKTAHDTADPVSGSGSGSGLGSQRAEVKELVRRAIPKLSPRQQQVLILKDIEGMDYAAIAEILEISQSTARVHAKDAREALREIIRRENPEIFG